MTTTVAARIRSFVIVSDTLGLRGVFAIGNYMHNNVPTDAKVIRVFINNAV
jgi:hypothetical protein